MTDLFNVQDPDEASLRDELTKKWKDKPLEELLKAKVESDLYVKTLERQKDELREDFMKAQEEIQKGKSMESLIDQLNRRQDPPAIPPQKPEEKTNALDVNEIEKLFEQKFEQKRISDIENRNFTDVQNKLKERFGSNASSVLQEQASNLGLSKEDVNSLAKKSPEAFFRMMGLDNQKKDLFMALPRNDVRNDNFRPNVEKRDWNFYQNMKAKNPKEYWAPKTQLQMHRDADALGDAFGIDN